MNLRTGSVWEELVFDAAREEANVFLHIEDTNSQEELEHRS